MASATRINKSEIVRKVLSDIGALSENPPEGWRKTVEDRLAKKSDEDGKPLKMNSISIYQIRRKEMDKKTGTKTKAKGKTKTKAKAKVRKAGDAINFDQLIEIKKVANTMGGLDQLEKAVLALKQLA